MSKKICPSWFHHSKQSEIKPDSKFTFKSPVRKGDFVVMTDEKPLSGLYTDYSVKSLTEAGIPLNAVPSVPQMSDSDVMSALSQLENININQN